MREDIVRVIRGLALAWAFALACGVAPVQAQTASTPAGWTPGFVANPPAAPAAQRKAVPLRNGPERVLYRYDNTSLLACPFNQVQEYFYQEYYGDIPQQHATSWCGAAQKAMDWANIVDPITSRRPYILESCYPGYGWFYSHTLPSGERFYSGGPIKEPARGINLVCSPVPFPPERCATGPGGFAPCPPNNPPVNDPPDIEDVNQNNGEGDDLLEVASSQCKASDPEQPTLPSPSFTGNPIFVGTGNKYQKEVDYIGPGALQVVRHYNSRLTSWVHNYLMRLAIWDSTVAAIRPDGKMLVYKGAGAGIWTANSTVVEQLSSGAIPGAPVGAAWRLQLADDTVEYYNNKGLPIAIVQRGGLSVTLQYDAELLQTVTDSFGRSLSYGYNVDQTLALVTAPGGETIAYAYDGEGRLDSVTHADGRSRLYHHEDSILRSALTGITDESGVRFATWEYDNNGRAVSSQHAGGVQSYTIQYGANGTTITDPMGVARVVQHQNIQGRQLLVASSAPCPNCNGDAAGKVVDAQGKTTQSTDYLGVVTQTVWDNARRLPTSITRAAGRPEAQTVSTQWHAQYRVPLQVDEAGRRTTYEYDSAGNMTRQTVQDTATGQSVSEAFEWTDGLLTAQTDAMGRTTRYQYSGGNLVRVTNAAGHVTQNAFDAAGRLVTTTYPTGAVATHTYDARGRLTSRSLVPAGGGAAEVEAFTWRPTGQIATATQPDGQVRTYSYDTAQRLVSVQSSRGNAVWRVLDAMGNPAITSYVDATGSFDQRRFTAYNSLNRVSQITDARSNLVANFDYDANGRPVSVGDGADRRTRATLDGLGRPVATQFADGAVATTAYNGLDQLTAATDPKGVQTSYTVDALGNVRATASPDAGAGSAQYDAAGNLTSRTDALGQTTQFQYDSLDRLTRITWADGQLAKFTYDGAGSAVGKLTRMEDPEGTTDYTWNGFGRLASRTQTLKNGATQTVRYTYNAGGDVASITYPSGKVVAYTRQQGQVTGISIDGVPFVTGVSYTGLGAPKAWSWASGDSASRAFDHDARLVTSELAAYTYDEAGRITAITQNLYMPVTTDTFALGASSYKVEYDSRNRITRMERDIPVVAPPPPPPCNPPTCTPPPPPPPPMRPKEDALRAPSLDPNPSDPTARFAQVETFSYDANGNRTTGLEQLRLINQNTGKLAAGLATQKNYSLDMASNRLLGFDQTITQTNARGSVLASVSLHVNYAIDAAGNQLGDGVKKYEHDASGRMAKLSYQKSGAQMSVLYLHNAQGQRVFKSEPSADATAPDGSVLDQGFMDWLHSRFAWLFATTRKNDKTKLGTAFVYEATDLLGEYGTGGAQSTGSTEYIYLPTDGGNMLVGAVINGEKYAVHTDHLGTPRRMTDAGNQPVWQWSYSAFGDNEPSVAARNFKDRSWAFAKGELTDLADGTDSVDNGPQFGRKMVKLNLRYPGQYFDDESNLHHNYFRQYDSRTGRYTQFDPLGMAGGWNGFGYVGGNPINAIDPSGLIIICVNGVCTNTSPPPLYDPRTDSFTPAPSGWSLPSLPDWMKPGPTLAKPPDNAYDPLGPKAPGKPGKAEDFKDPKGGENWVRNPNGRGYGWQGADGGVWCPTGPDSGSTGDAHGGPHWDVQYPGGRYDNVYPGGRRR